MGGMTLLVLLLWVGVTVSTVVDLQKRIIGGEPCGPDEHRYHVKLIPNDGTRDRLCGGTLISDQWILTAAHCWKSGWTIKAVLGLRPGPGETVPITAKPVIFKDNNYKTHDIMLLKLPRPTRFEHIQLPDCDNHPTPRPNTHAKVQIAGYGATTTGRNYIKLREESPNLHCANIEVVDCLWHNPLQRNHPVAHQHMFCGYTDRVDTSPGDSGGGVVYNRRIYGVHSTSGALAFAQPVGFMKVCDYIGWIKRKMTKTSDKLKACLGCG